MEIIAKVKCIVPRQKFGPLRGLKNTVLAVGKASTAFWARPPGSVSVRSPLDSSSTACALLFFTLFQSKTLAIKALKKVV